MTDEIKGIVLVGSDGDDRFPKTYGSLVQNANGDTLENVEAGAQVNLVETLELKHGNTTTSITVSGKKATIDLSAYAKSATTLSGYGITDAYTKTQADSAISSAVSGKADSATTLAGYGITDAYTKTQTDSAISSAVSGKANAATTLSGYGITDAYSKSEVDGKISSSYKAAGSAAAIANLGSLDASHEGFVYNMTAQFTTTADFVEGAGKKHPAGTNVAIVNVGTAQSPSYKYDVLAGFVDLSSYDTHIANDDIHVTAANKTAWSGKQDAITSSAKLSADLVDDSNATNKFVTASDKTNWNGKQAAITSSAKLNADLVDDSTSNNKFVSASDKTAWNGKQAAITSSAKLSADLVDDSSTTNKFVTATEKSTWNGKANASDVYTKTAADAKFLTIANGLSYRELT